MENAGHVVLIDQIDEIDSEVAILILIETTRSRAKMSKTARSSPCSGQQRSDREYWTVLWFIGVCIISSSFFSHSFIFPRHQRHCLVSLRWLMIIHSFHKGTIFLTGA